MEAQYSTSQRGNKKGHALLAQTFLVALAIGWVNMSCALFIFIIALIEAT